MIQPTTPTSLCAAIANRVEDISKSYASQTELDKQSKAPTIYLYSLPEKGYVGDLERENFPFILITPRGGDDSDDYNALVDIDLAVGVYDHDDQAWRTVLDIIQRVRLNFYENPIIGAYELGKVRKWEIVPFHDQPDMCALGLLKTQWKMPQIQRVTDINVYSHEAATPKGSREAVNFDKLNKFLNGG